MDFSALDTLTALDIRSLHASYRGGESPVTIVEKVFARISTLADPGIFIDLAGMGEVIEAAQGLPPFNPVAYPLWGIPFAVKDNIDVAGHPTTAACPGYARFPAHSAPVVAQLIAAGALFIGKTNLDQFATGLVGVRTPYPVPKNAFDPARVPGGSSSGSAVAVAQGLVSFALGTDTAGSGRVPAGLNNLVGLKPSLGALSTRGVVPACRTLDCVSIFATTVEDAGKVFDVAARYDAEDPYSRPLEQAPSRMARVVGVPRREDRLFFGDSVMEAAFEVSLHQLAALGVSMREVDMSGFFEVARLLYEGPWVAERRAAIRAFMDSEPGAIHPVTYAILAKADAISATDTFEALYRLAALKRKSEAIWQEIDALIVPTTPIAPTLAQLAADPIGPNSKLGTYTNFVNLLDLAAIAVPGPFRGDGFPAGITFIAPSGNDHRLAALASRFFPGIGGRAGHFCCEAA